MAPSSGHLLVPKALRAVKFAIHKTTNLIRSKFPQSSQSTSTSTTINVSIQPIPVRINQQPLHPVAALRQSRSQQHRWDNSNFRNFSTKSTSKAIFRPLRSSLPTSTTSKALVRSGGAPFASTLRPNLTGGTLPRTAGGYAIGGTSKGGVRHFSHTPASPAQVISNVSTAIRAFWLSGQKASYDGIDAKTGEKKWKAVSDLQKKAGIDMFKAVESRNLKGTTLEFRLSPTVTALSPFATSAGAPAISDSHGVGFKTLGTDGLLECLATDFARALKDLSAIFADLKCLSRLGDLPISLSSTSSGGSNLQVQFPGCDAETVSRLCDEVGIRRGLIQEDEGWRQDKDAEMALLFPFAPSQATSNISDEEYYPEAQNSKKKPQVSHVQEQVDWKNMLSPSEHTITASPRLSTMSINSADSYHHIREELPHSWLDGPEGYESMRDSDYDENDILGPYSYGPTPANRIGEYEGLEGIYKFLTECDSAKR